MKRTFLALIVAALAIGLQPMLTPTAEAATPNISVGGGQVMVLPVFIAGQRTATVTPVKFAMPQPCDMIGVGATARASGGTSPTLTVDLQDDGVSVLSSAISITAGTWSEGTISNAAIGDESVMTVVLTIGGTSPTWDDITVVLTCARK
ncbi:MAG: hypothetical protein ACT4P3_09500 [Betaproteobacteria bacterium]